MAFAHGKILLLGEHAVVHGRPALAAGLSRGMSAEVVDGAEPRLQIPAWGVDVTPHDDSAVARAFAALLGALPDAFAGATVRVVPGIPGGAGLGSSAALAVATARALAEHAQVTLDEAALFDAAMAAEQVFHGNPSGLDHAAAMRGGLMRYVRGTPPSIEPVVAAQPISLVVAQVEPGADTGRMVGGVASRLQRLPTAIGATLDAIAALVDRAQSAVEAGDQATLGEAMTVNHGLLAALGVSTPALDVACHKARTAGALGAKLTGAGGGGCIVALVDDASADAVVSALAGSGGMVLRASVG
jgi:mevalonate kinase